MKRISILVLFISVYCCLACSLSHADDMQPLRMGLVADTQVQTEQATRDVPFYKNNHIDKVIPVAIRPPALNITSTRMLAYFLEKLIKEEGVNVIFYLGDATNNGCEDEVSTVLAELDKARKKHKVPIFLAIGNHDYLGAGNTANEKTRAQLCSDTGKSNPPLHKSEVIRRFHSFNVTSSDMAKENHSPAKVYFRDSFGYRSLTNPHDREDKQIFLATYLVLDDKEIILLDTSDYGDKGVIYTFGRQEFFGAVGWISTKDSNSQLAWVLKQRAAAGKAFGAPKARYVLTHYPPKDLGVVARKVSDTAFFNNYSLFHRLSPIFAPTPPQGNYWISAHTHDQAKVGKLTPTEFGAQVVVDTLNFGSTTDHVPHAIAVNTSSSHAVDGMKRFGKGSYRDVTIPDDACSKITPMLYSKNVTGIISIVGRDDIATACGINASYRKEKKWSPEATKLCRFNFETVVTALSEETGIESDLVQVCIGVEASKMEKASR